MSTITCIPFPSVNSRVPISPNSPCHSPAAVPWDVHHHTTVCSGGGRLPCLQVRTHTHMRIEMYIMTVKYPRLWYCVTSLSRSQASSGVIKPLERLYNKSSGQKALKITPVSHAGQAEHGEFGRLYCTGPIT